MLPSRPSDPSTPYPPVKLCILVGPCQLQHQQQHVLNLLASQQEVHGR